MKILLVKPQTELLVAKRLQEGFLHLEPLELEIVAGGIPKENDVQILDLSVENKPNAKFKKKLINYKPQMIGFSAYSNTFHIVKRLALIAKECDPTVKVIVGGIHATLRPKDFAVKSIDIIVRGEGGTVIGEIIRRFHERKELYFGNAVLSPSDPDFEQKAEKDMPFYPLVEQIPMARRDLIDHSKYFCIWTSSDTGRLSTIFPRVASMRTSQGCPFSCSFCVIHQVMHRKYLRRQPEDVIDEIIGLKENYIYFVDDEMFADTHRAKIIAELLLERNIRKKYISWARSDTIAKHPELFKLWKKAGLDVVYVGLESMNEEALNEYNKKISVETNRKAIAILKNIGIMLHASFIVRPDFSVEDFKNLEATIAEISPVEITFTVLSPSPGTQMWNDNMNDFICDPFKYYDCMHTLVPTKLTLRRFYQHFGRLYSIALRSNPLRINKIKIPLRDLVRAMISGTKYVFSLYLIYKDYPPIMWLKAGAEQRKSLAKQVK